MNMLSSDCELRVTFNPSYVLAGSAKVEVISEGQTTIIEEATSGYQALWHHILRLCREDQNLLYPLETILADLNYALDLTDKAQAFLTEPR